MAVSLPYLASYKNVGTLFDKIAAAKIPPKFTHEFLQSTIGLTSTADRPLISLLRHLGFIDQSGTPLPAYSLLKNEDERRSALASGVRHAYGPLFAANETADKLPLDKLRSLISQVAGTDADMAKRIANTFASLAKLGDFTEKAELKTKDVDDNEEIHADTFVKGKVKGLRTEFQYNIQVQLPTNGTEETYLNIFNAIRKTFQ